MSERERIDLALLERAAVASEIAAALVAERKAERERVLAAVREEYTVESGSSDAEWFIDDVVKRLEAEDE